MLACLNNFHIFVWVGFQLREGRFVYNTHTQMHTSNYLLSVPRNCSDPDKNGIVKLNENVKLFWPV